MPRIPADIITPPRWTRAPPRKPSPVAEGKWLTASVTDDIPAAVIAAGFAEASRRDPAHQRAWIALVDGNRREIEPIRAEADCPAALRQPGRGHLWVSCRAAGCTAIWYQPPHAEGQGE